MAPDRGRCASAGFGPAAGAPTPGSGGLAPERGGFPAEPRYPNTGDRLKRSADRPRYEPELWLELTEPGAANRADLGGAYSTSRSPAAGPAAFACTGLQLGRRGRRAESGGEAPQLLPGDR